jgi:hypothetical protein
MFRVARRNVKVNRLNLDRLRLPDHDHRLRIDQDGRRGASDINPAIYPRPYVTRYDDPSLGIRRIHRI